MKKIVIIEDEDSIRENLIELLQIEGFKVFWAKNGMSGIDLVRDEKPDLVISDIMMPEINGFDVLKTIRSDIQTAAIPFIFLTAKSTQQDIRKGMNIGSDDFLIKPFDPRELLNAINSRLDKQQLIEQHYKGLLQTKDMMLEDALGQLQLLEQQHDHSQFEKQYLLKEIHHRVKNNLQIISGLLQLQANYIKNEAVLQLFNETFSRIQAMALIHEQLYHSKDLGRIDFSDYIEKLITQLALSYNINSNDVKFFINSEKVHLTINVAIPVGLIINELISNAIKYAFVRTNKGEIRISFHQKDNNFELLIRDNGIGFPEDLDYRSSESLGLGLVSALVKQINGTIELDRRIGTLFKIRFALQQEERNTKRASDSGQVKFS